MSKAETNPNRWTWGAEHELADWDTRQGWEGFGRDPEPNICNSNGIAADTTLKCYPFGAEINSPPTVSPQGQVDLLLEFLDRHPRATVNWRTGMHVHIRVPGLRDDLKMLKRIQRYIENNKAIYDAIDPLPIPTHEQYPDHVEYKAARRRYNWMRMSHMTSVPTHRVEQQMKATTVQEFFELEVPKSKTGKVLWHAQARSAISLRQLLQTDTIEFRHFPGVLIGSEFMTALEWCTDFLIGAIDGSYTARELFDGYYADRKFPTLDSIYCHWQEKRWLATSCSKNNRETREKNVAKILRGEFDDHIDDTPHLRLSNPRGVDCY